MLPEAEYDEKRTRDVDAENVDHKLVFDAGAHNQTEPRAVKHEVQNDQRRRDDTEHLDAIGRVVEKAEIDRAAAPTGHRQPLRNAAEPGAHGLNKNNTEAEGREDLILMRPSVIVADQSALDDNAQQQERRGALP